MARSYIPSKDADAALWAQTFDNAVKGDNTAGPLGPAQYGLTLTDSGTIHTYVNAFTTALATVRDPATNTPPNVAAKDGAKAAMLDIVRPYAVGISQSKVISNELKAAAGVTVRDSTPTPIPTPATIPVLSILGALPNQITMAFKDSGSGAPRAKPSGVLAMELRVLIAVAVATDPGHPDMVEWATKTPTVVDFSSGDVGKKATFFGRWVTRTGLEGPWSSAVSMTIPG